MKVFGQSKAWILLIVLLTIGCDQVSKEWIRKEITPKAFIPLVEDYLILTNVENTGAMLGFGQHFPPIAKRLLFQILPVIILLILLYRILTKQKLDTVLLVAFALIIGGGIGNLIDRIAFGSVTDFFQIRVGMFRTGIFNMADMGVTAGVFLLLFLVIKGKKISY